MNTKTSQASWLQTTIISALVIAGIYCLPTQSNANDSWSMGGNSFSLILAQNQGGFFKRLAAKNRAKQAQRQTYNAPRQQSSQPAQPTSNLNQWNPFHNPRQQSSQPTQQTSSLNQWNPFHNPRPQSSQPTQQTSSSNQWNPFHNPRQQSSQPTQQTSSLNQWNPFHNPRPQSSQPAQQTSSSNQWNPFQNQNQGQTQPNQSSNPSGWNPFQNQQNQNTQNPNTAASSGLTSAERTNLVNFHNQVRSEVGVGPVRWSGRIAAHAQQWADEIARSGNFRHRQPNTYGENLAQGTAGYYTVVKLAEMWYNEKRFYTPGRPFSNSDMRAGHYTQMVWRDSTQMGAGKAIITSGQNKGNVVLVCNYAQRGNMIGQKPF